MKTGTEYPITVTISSENLVILITSAIKQGLEEYETNSMFRKREIFMTKSQIAKRMRKSPHTVKKWIDKGLLKTNLSGQISEYDLMQFLNSYQKIALKVQKCKVQTFNKNLEWQYLHENRANTVPNCFCFKKKSCLCSLNYGNQ